MYAEFFLAKDWRLHCYGLGATALLIQLANAYLAVQINAWIARLYDMLQLCVTAPEQAAPQLAPLGWEFVVFSLPWATLAPASQYVMKRWALAWREALTEAYTRRWQLDCGGAALPVASASQRIQEGTQMFAKNLGNVGNDAVVAGAELCTLVPMLWSVGSGWLVLLCVASNAAGLAASLVVGEPLQSELSDEKSREADLRKALVLAEDRIAPSPVPSSAAALSPAVASPSVASPSSSAAATPPRDPTASGAAHREMRRLFAGVKASKLKLFLTQGRFEVWLRCYARLMDAAPKVVTVPWLLSGRLTLGTYMQIRECFNQVQDRLSLFSRRWGEISNLRSVALRLRELEAALDEAAAANETPAADEAEADAAAAAYAAAFGAAAGSPAADVADMARSLRRRTRLVFGNEPAHGKAEADGSNGGSNGPRVAANGGGKHATPEPRSNGSLSNDDGVRCFACLLYTSPSPRD